MALNDENSSIWFKLFQPVKSFFSWLAKLFSIKTAKNTPSKLDKKTEAHSAEIDKPWELEDYPIGYTPNTAQNSPSKAQSPPVQNLPLISPSNPVVELIPVSPEPERGPIPASESAALSVPENVPVIPLAAEPLVDSRNEEIEGLFPKAMIEAFGLENLASLPVVTSFLKLKDSRLYSSFDADGRYDPDWCYEYYPVLVSDLQGYKAVRSLTSTEKPLISFIYNNEVITIFDRAGQGIGDTYHSPWLELIGKRPGDIDEYNNFGKIGRKFREAISPAASPSNRPC